MKLIFKFRIISITLIFIFVSFSALIFVLPPPPLLTHTSFSTAVYDDQHHLLRLTLSHDDKYRLHTPLSQISPTLIATTLLQEDQYFWKHRGVNPFAILKAVWQTYIVGARRVGASTITMQVARLKFGLHSHTFLGKALQIWRALQLERYYTKKQILEAYLNLAPYGGNIEGVGAASLIYFNKKASELSLLEALSLTVIPQNPHKRTPSLPYLNTARQQLFNRWVETHPEDKKQLAFIHLPLEMRSLHQLPFSAPHAVNYILSDSSRAGLSIQTTLDRSLQQTLERIARHYVHRHMSLGVQNAAVMLVDVRDMSIKAAVGSIDFFNQTIQGQINGTEIKRSPGSTLKPFIYGLALDQGLIHPYTILKDVPHYFGHYNPENFDYDFVGPIKAKDALILSRNIPAIYLTKQLKKPTLYQFLEAANIRDLKPESAYGLALSLGGAELSMHELISLYAMLVNKGVWHPLRLRQDVPDTRGKRLLSSEASFLILDMLKDTPHLEAGKPQMRMVAWKTGTSSAYRDAWSVGAFGPYVLGVWVGNFNNKGNVAFIGKKMAAPLFFEIIDAIQHEYRPLTQIEPHPEQLQLTQVAVCKASGMLPTRYCQDTELTWFIPGKSPIHSDTIYREVPINKLTGLRTCHYGTSTRFEVYEFWSTDLLKIFKQAGIQRRIPPAFEPDCSQINTAGLRPQISSPQNDVHYIINAHTPLSAATIPFTVVTDGDVRLVYWFINETYLTQTNPDKPFLWPAKAGKYVVRVVDDHGRSDARDIIVQVNG